MKMCFECGSPFELEDHHVVPKSLGGTKTVVLCSVCHGKVHGIRRMVSAKTLTKRALQNKKRRGERVSGLAPRGCRFEGGRVVADDVERRVLTDVEALRRSGWTLDAIAGELNRRGVVTRSGGSHTTSSVWRIVEALKVGRISCNRTDSRKKEVAA